MTAQKRARKKKYFTVAEANATLPLLRSILRDITELARDLSERHDRLARVESSPPPGKVRDAYQEELHEIRAEYERGKERMEELIRELYGLGVELKDPYTGLVDFPCVLDGHEVYLCWRLGEPEVSHWHELDAGFAGRQKLQTAPMAKR
ncbi:MAG: DUF2203 domain-containing protein [Gemmataceae bacterium]|nr:DUF2203 domain-containing protein [Gemmataceae bacterium]